MDTVDTVPTAPPASDVPDTVTMFTDSAGHHQYPEMPPEELESMYKRIRASVAAATAPPPPPVTGTLKKPV